MITIMNISDIMVQHKIKIFEYPPPCRLYTNVCSINYTTNVYNRSVFKRQCSSESVRLSLISAMDVHGIKKLHVL